MAKDIGRLTGVPEDDLPAGVGDKENGTLQGSWSSRSPGVVKCLSSICPSLLWRVVFCSTAAMRSASAADISDVSRAMTSATCRS